LSWIFHSPTTVISPHKVTNQTQLTAAKPNITLFYVVSTFHFVLLIICFNSLLSLQTLFIYSFKLLIVNVYSSSCFFTNFCFSLVSTMEAKLLNATTIYKPSIPFSSFHLTTPRSCFSFNPISYFPQKSNLSVKAQAASIGWVL
jgi:hypothetical protein